MFALVARQNHGTRISLQITENDKVTGGLGFLRNDKKVNLEGKIWLSRYPIFTSKISKKYHGKFPGIYLKNSHFFGRYPDFPGNEKNPGKLTTLLQAITP